MIGRDYPLGESLSLTLTVSLSSHFTVIPLRVCSMPDTDYFREIGLTDLQPTTQHYIDCAAVNLSCAS